MRSTLVLLGLGAALGCAQVPASSAALQARSAQYGAQDDAGLVRFLFDDFSGLALETFAVPWKVSTTALLLHRNGEGASFDERGAVQLMERYGFVVPEKLGNWDPRTPAPSFTRPVGVVSGTVRLGSGMELELANTGCATCHAGRTFDADGTPTREVWIGLPNGSIDLDQYARDLSGALSAVAAGGDDDFLATVRRAFPDVSEGEQRAIRSVVLPRVRAGTLVRMGTGVMLGAQQPIASVPSLAFRDFKTSLLIDGVYAPQGRSRHSIVREAEVDAAHLAAMGAIPSVFTTTTLGVPPRAGVQNAAKVREVFRSTARAAPPPFPGPVDAAKAERGEQVFSNYCQGCHGTYDRSTRPARLVEYPNKMVAQKQIATDVRRQEVATAEVLGAFDRSDFGALVSSKATGGSVPPILTSVWATAPYLHNGSVPTLWHLLHPDERPARFQQGGHRLDYAKMGIALDPQDPTRYPVGYRPTSRPTVYDTSQPGHGAGGHVKQIRALSEEDKDDVIEYLKLL